MSDNNNEFGAFFSGFLIGGLVGAAVSLLLAPQSGEETREIIRVRGIELRDQATQYADDTRIRAEEVARDAMATAEDLQKRGQVILEEQKSRVSKTGSSAPKEEPKEEKPAEEPKTKKKSS
jgi:gas vesicle protein